MDQKTNSSVAEPQTKEFVISRTFDAPRELMFRVWTDPEHMQRWWGPKGFKVIHSKMDLRPGGIYHYGMLSPNSQEMWGRFVFREIVKPERLVFISSFSDEKGNVTRHPMHLSWPLEMLSKITFTEQAGKTTVTVRWAPLNATAEERKTFEDGFSSMQQGWGGTFEQLGEYLAKALKRELVITRILDAPRGLVWKAWTDPKQMAQWWGPEGFTNPVCKMDVRPGGAMYIVMRAPDGVEYPMTGVFQEIKEHERLVFTAVAVDEKGNHLLESLTTVTFAEHGGKTKLTVQASAVGLVAIAARMLEGMEAGWTQSLVRLERLVAKM
ncbi:MAG: SRPBCC domain-containing protein [Gammaproteobacteria bacterium]|nr:SRPBCC domain-containing protein [Gammaproteobacteria bacterium]